MTLIDDSYDPETSDFHRYCAQQLLKKIYERHAVTVSRVVDQNKIPAYLIPFDRGTEDMLASWLFRFEKDQLRKINK